MKGRALTIGASVLAAWCCAAENDARGDQGSGAPAAKRRRVPGRRGAAAARRRALVLPGIAASISAR